MVMRVCARDVRVVLYATQNAKGCYAAWVKKSFLETIFFKKDCLQNLVATDARNLAIGSKFRNVTFWVSIVVKWFPFLLM